MTDKQKLDKIHFILLTHIGDKASLETRILEVITKKTPRKQSKESK